MIFPDLGGRHGAKTLPGNIAATIKTNAIAVKAAAMRQ